jgi:hypothetical protein
MTFFIMAAPCVGIALANWNRILTAGTVAILSLSACIWIVANNHHPLVGPQSIFRLDDDTSRLIKLPRLVVPYRQAADAARGARQVAFIFTSDNWEYPPLEMMLLRQNPAIRIETFPGPWVVNPPTANHGFDPTLKPHVIIRFDGGIPRIVGRSDSR